MKKVIKEFLIVSFLMVWGGVALGSDDSSNGGFLASVISTEIPQNAEWNLEVIDIKTGRIMESKTTHNEQNGKLVPASLVKLFTAGTALNYNAQNSDKPLDMTTTVSIDKKGNLYIKGRGNAFLNRRDIVKMVVDISSVNKISKIKADIIADNSLFDSTGITRTRKGPAYARPGALGMESHTANVEVTVGKIGEAPLVRVMPLNKGVKIINTAKTVDSNRNTLVIEKLNDKTYRVSGNMSKNSRTLRKRFALDDSAVYTAEVLKSLLEEMGVKVKGTVRRGKTPENAKVLSEIKAMDLNKMVKFMNIHSVNLVADNILLLLGAEKFGGIGTAQKGLSAVDEFLNNMKLDIKDITLKDGSGLSDENKITSSFMARYLYEVSKQSWFNDFKESLPKHNEGTSKKFGFTQKDFRVKVGALENVFAVAGYGVNGNGREVAFSYIANIEGATMGGLHRTGVTLMNKMAEGMAK